MEMASPNSIFVMPKATADEPRDKTTLKTNSDDEYCLSFPSMLEQKQATDPKKETLTEETSQNGTDAIMSKAGGKETTEGKTGMSKEGLAKEVTANTTPATVTSISGFLQSIALTSSGEKADTTQAATVQDQVKVTTGKTAVATTVAPEVATDTETKQIVEQLVAEVSASQTVNTEATVQTPGKSAEQIDQPLVASKDVPVQTRNPVVSTAQVPEEVKTIPGDKNIASGAENTVQDKPVAEKTPAIMKDYVLATNKTEASTYSAPEKLVRDMATQQALPTKETATTAVNTGTIKMETGTTVEAPVNTTTESREPAVTQVAVETNNPDLVVANTTTKTSTEATHDSEDIQIQNDTTTSLESFTVPTGISTSTGHTPAVQTTGSASTSISADIRQQVVEHLASRLEGPIGNEKVTLYLNPEKLGQIEVQITAKNDSLTVTMTVPDGQVEKAIQDSVKDLTESLLARGGRFSQVDVKVETKSAQSDRDQQRENANKEKESKDNQGSQKEHDQQQDPQQFTWASAGQEG